MTEDSKKEIENIDDASDDVEITKCTFVEGDPDFIVREGQWFKIECKRMFDSSLLSIHNRDFDSLIGFSTDKEKYTEVRLRMGYFKTQLERILHNAIRQMRLNESAQISFEVDPDLLDESLTNLKKNHDKSEKIYIDLKFDINLIDIENEASGYIEIYNLNEKQLYEIAMEHKTEANDLFKKNIIRTAFQRYHKSISNAIIANQVIKSKEEEGIEINDQELKNNLLKLKSQLHLNMAACQLKTSNYEMVIKNCNKCLELDNLNEKALFRRATALIAINEFDKAINDLKLGLTIDPSAENTDIKQKLALAEKLRKEYETKMASRLKKCSTKFHCKDLWFHTNLNCIYTF